MRREVREQASNGDVQHKPAGRKPWWLVCKGARNGDDDHPKVAKPPARSRLKGISDSA